MAQLHQAVREELAVSLQDVLLRQPDYAYAWIYLGTVRLHQGRLAEAEASYRQQGAM